jgi:hypothetical protein
VANTSNSTLFGRLEEIRATVKRARTDVLRLGTLIKGRASVGGERTPAEDMRIQLRQSLVMFDKLLDELAPIAEFHLDQPIRATSSKTRMREVNHG